jgi:hypothetical protein
MNMNAKSTSGPLIASLLSASVLAAGSFIATDAGAVGTRNFVLGTLETFQGGDLTGVAVGSDGTVRAGLTLANLPIADATSVWDAVLLPDGTALLGTGTGGRVYKVKTGQASIAANTGTMAVASLAIGFDGAVFAGTFPDGKIFKIDPKAAPAAKDGGAELQPWATLPDTEDVWDLAFDAKNKALYAATGPEGKLYRIDANGKAQVHFDSDDPHLVSVAIAADGTVYAGSSGKALLYHISGPGRATVVHDFEGDDVRSIAIVPAGMPHAGDMYVVANDYRGALKSLRPLKRAKLQGTSDDQQEPRPGKGKLVRFGQNGVLEPLLDDNESHFVSLAIDDQGLPYVGTGHEGKVITVDDHHTTRIVADTEERQAAALAIAGKNRFIASSDPVVFHEITGSGGANAVWTSKVLDAGMRAHYGMLDWTADGALELQTRSGNTDKPDTTWSDWSGALAQPGEVKSPAARYLQIRARWNKDPAAVLREVKLAFVTDNARAVLTDVSAGDTKTDTGGANVPASGGAPDEPNNKLRISWKVDNPDNDELRFRVFFRPVGNAIWRSLLGPDEILNKKEYSWDTTGMPEGRYRVRIDASDELANPPGRALQHSLESSSFLIDGTPPVLSKLTLKGNKLSGTASDGIGPIARIEVALVGAKSFYPVLPTDGVLDEATETFDVDVTGIVPDGPNQLVLVRTYDSAGNRTSATVSR